MVSAGEAELRAALARSELVLRYQPQVDLLDGRLAGVEALVRWNHPDHGLLGPAAFFPLVERAGLWPEVTRAVLDRATADAAGWQAAGAPVRVWVNVAAADMTGDHHLARDVTAALARHGLPAALLGLELTESGVLRNLDEAIEVLTTLRHHGIDVALDDFGTGFSSLTHLRALPVNAVKIDRSFVSHIDHSRADAAITSAVIEVCESLGVDSIVEGVERIEEWDTVARLGASHAQGFLISPPAPADHVVRWVETAWHAVVEARRRSPGEADAASEWVNRSGPDVRRSGSGSGRRRPIVDPTLAVWTDRIVRTTDLSVVVVDADRTIVFASGEVEEHLGAPVAALTGRPLLRIVVQADAPIVERFLRDADAGAWSAGRPIVRFVHPDGTEVAVELAGGRPAEALVPNGTALLLRRADDERDAGRVKLIGQLIDRITTAALDETGCGFERVVDTAAAELGALIGSCRVSGPGDDDSPTPGTAHRLTVQLRGGGRRFGTVIADFGARTPCEAELTAVRHFASSIALGRAAHAAPGSDERDASTLLAQIDGAEDVVCVVDTATNVRYFSAAAERMLGYGRDELMCMALRDLTHPDDLATARAAFDRARGPGGAMRGEWRLVHRDGREIWIECTGRVGHDRVTGSAVLVMRDIGERVARRAEEARTDQLLEAAVQISQQAMHTDLEAGLERLDDFARTLAELLDVELVFIDELDRAQMTNRAAHIPDGSDTTVVPTYRVSDAPLVANRLERRTPLFYESRMAHADLWRAFGRSDSENGSGALLPLVANGRLVGSLAIASTRPRTWTTETKATLNLVADTIAALLDRHRLERRRKAVERRFRQLSEHAADVVSLVDVNGVLLYTSPAVRKLLGREPDAVIGLSVYHLFHPDDHADLGAEIDALDDGEDGTWEVRLSHADGSWRWVSARCRKVVGEDGTVEYWASVRDIEQRRKLEVELHHQATHDPLTDLPNRTVFTNTMARLADGAELPVAVVLIDLDRFKSINDTLGHSVGDMVLVEVAERLRLAVRTEDVIARMGGDEFVVLCPRSGPRDAMRIVERLHGALDPPIDIGAGRVLCVQCSVGVAIANERTDLDELLHQADLDMYRVKRTKEELRATHAAEPIQPVSARSNASDR